MSSQYNICVLSQNSTKQSTSPSVNIIIREYIKIWFPYLQLLFVYMQCEKYIIAVACFVQVRRLRRVSVVA